VRRPRPHAAPGGLLVALVCLVVLVTAGCTALPESGPVVDASTRSTVDDDTASGITAVAPTEGMAPSAVVTGFLNAMQASPIRVDIAQQFLSEAAAAEWDPTAGTITYADAQPPQDQRQQVSVSMLDAEYLDRSGAYRGRLPEARQTLRFEMTVEDGEYRVTNPPDALVVQREWFNQRYRPASLYFFDPTGRILVPEPVYVPRGDRLATTLVARLLQGPGRLLGRVVRSYVPRGIDAGLSVQVSIDGIAEVDLGGGPETAGSVGAERMLAQLAWTLQQQPGIRALRVTIGGEPLLGPDGEETYAVDDAAYAPTGEDPSTDLYVVRDRALHTRAGNELEPVRGPFGGSRPIADAAVSISGTRAAALGLERRSLVVADLADDVEGESSSARVVLRGATNLGTPVWDFADRLWVVDRNRGRAVVHVVVNGRDRVVEVPGVSGEQVRAFLVSRDGTRVVAVVAGRDGASDEVRAGRVELDDQGSVARVPGTQLIDAQTDLPLRVDDIAWTSPTTIAELTPLEVGSIYEVRTIGVDGAPGGPELQPVPITGRVVGLAGTPLESLPTFAVTPTNIQDLSDGNPFGFVGGRATSVRYAG
jgi:hypothetical protein